MSKPASSDSDRALAALELCMRAMEANMEKIMVAQRAVIAISLKIAERLGTGVVEADSALVQSDLDKRPSPSKA